MKKTAGTFVLASLFFALCAPPATRAENPGNAVDAFLEAKYAAAESLLKDKQYPEALKIAEAIIALNPSQALTERTETLRQFILDSQMRDEALECRIAPEKQIYLAGETVRLTVRLYNRSLAEVTIPLLEKESAKTGEKEPNHLLLTMATKDFDALGSVLAATRDLDHRIEEEIRLAPGDFWETSVEPEGLTGGIGRQVCREVRFRATLAPLIITEGQETRAYAPYRSAESSITVLPENARAALADPDALKRALREDDATGIFHAAMILSQNGRNRTIRTLAAALKNSRENSAAERATIVGMQHILGAYRRLTRESWLSWWDAAWTYYCADDEGDAVKIALLKKGDAYLITCEGRACGPRELVESMAQAAARGTVRAEIRCGRNVALPQFLELFNAVRGAGLKDVRVTYADAVEP